MQKKKTPGSYILVRIIIVIITLASPIYAEQLYHKDVGENEAFVYPGKGFVRIVRDTYGVPHVFASNEKDLYFGWGYAVAQDRLEQIFTAKLNAEGRYAEVVGEEGIHIDFILRSHKHKALAKQLKKKTSKKHKAVLAAYCNGVNAYIKENRSKIPSWITKITPLDFGNMAVASTIFTGMSSISQDYMRRNNSGSNPAPYIPVTVGSNAFAVSALRSAKGNALLVYDSHSAWLDPMDMYYEIHISCPDFFAVGNTNPGGPFFNNGFNGKIAWAGTASSPDLGDVYRYQTNADGSQYLSRNGWKNFEKWNETIKVKTNANGGFRNHVLTLRKNDIGMVWAIEDGYAYVGRGPDFYTSPALLNYALARLTAGSVEEFMDLFKPEKNSITGHKFAADLNGKIGYIYAAPWPFRNPDLDWSRPVDGTDPRSEWLGYVAYEDLPKVIDPDSGWLQNCNDDPRYATENSGIPTNLPSRLEFPGIGERGKRLTELLKNKKNVKFNDMVKFSLDTLVWKARFWVPILISAFDTYADSLSLRGTDTENAINLFRSWNYRADKTSRAMTVFHYFYNRFNTLLYQDVIALEDASQIPENTKRNLLIELGSAAAQVRGYFGRVNEPWGDVQYFRYGGKDFPLAGSGGSGGWLQTLRSTMIQTEQPDGRISVTGGSAYQYIIELSKKPKMWSGLPIGESSDPNSIHFNDLTELFSNNKYKPVWYEWNQLKKHIESDITISTKKRK